MGLLDGFEKLINEHGSAAILKERIALANDKYAALEQKLSASELRAKELESENQGLRHDLEEAQVQIQNLKSITAQSHGPRLEEIREKLLLLLTEIQTSRLAKLPALPQYIRSSLSFISPTWKRKDLSMAAISSVEIPSGLFRKMVSAIWFAMVCLHNPALNPSPFGRWTALKRRRLALRWSAHLR